MTCSLRSAGITPASTLLRGSPPLTGASVLSASRLEPLAPCMGSLLSSGFRAAISLSCFLDRFLCSTWNPVSSPRPAVLQSRRAQELSRLAVAPTFPRALPLPGPYLDSSEHGGTLDAVGDDDQRGARFQSRGSIAPQPCMR